MTPPPRAARTADAASGEASREREGERGRERGIVATPEGGTPRVAAGPDDRSIAVEALAASAFAPYGDVVELAGEPSAMINRGLCARHSDLAALEFAGGGRVGLSLFAATPYPMPHTLDLLERHPDGSQAFLPLSTEPFLVIVAEDEGGRPVRPRAFVTDGAQGVNYHRGTWHGVLTPLAATHGDATALFAVVDRIGPGANLEEHALAPPYRVHDRHGLIARARARSRGATRREDAD